MKCHQGWPKCRSLNCANGCHSLWWRCTGRIVSTIQEPRCTEYSVAFSAMYESRNLERFLTLSAIWSSTFWGMFLMHMCLYEVRSSILSWRRKKTVYGSSDFWAIWMHRHYWIQWYGCVVCILHYTVGWSIRIFVPVMQPQSSPVQQPIVPQHPVLNIQGCSSVVINYRWILSYLWVILLAFELIC